MMLIDEVSHPVGPLTLPLLGNLGDLLKGDLPRLQAAKHIDGNRVAPTDQASSTAGASHLAHLLDPNLEPDGFLQRRCKLWGDQARQPVSAASSPFGPPPNSQNHLLGSIQSGKGRRGQVQFSWFRAIIVPDSVPRP